jgi:cysteine synthase B
MHSLLELVGNTPIVELKNINPHKGVKIYGKLEGHNPGGSVKDRAALGMIKGALDRGEIGAGVKLIEATSGNTGIALAMIARLFNLEIELVMPENATKERVQTMEAFGAKVILTPQTMSMEGAIDYAHNQVSKGGYVMLNQFANPDNYMAHYRSTGPEIWAQTNEQITHFVSSMGTTGTIMGVSKYLKEKNKNIQIVGVQPTDGSNIPGIRRWPQEYLPKIFDPSRVDKIIDVSQAEATAMANTLARTEAVFSGMSSGGSVTAALKLAEKLEHGVIVCIICDRGDRYLSSNLFAKN